jgi:hypothetical protein
MSNYIPFWSNSSSILINKNFIYQLWPTSSMNLEAKLNAITRLVMLLTVIGFLLTMSFRILLIGIITIAIIYSLYIYRKKKIVRNMLFKEGFLGNSNLEATNNSSPVKVKDAEMTTSLSNVLKSNFYETNKKNPFGNVLLTEIMDTPNRPAAAPAFNPDVIDKTTSVVKKQTQMLNPTIDSTNNLIYGDIKDNYDLEKSLINFYSTPNTRVANDQGAYADFLYGSMYSGKESTPEGSWMRVKDNYRYILY